MTGARSSVAVRRSRTVGCTSRANGRIWSRMIGVVSRRNGRWRRSDGRQLARERPQPLERRAELLGERVRVLRAWWSSARARPGRAGAPRAGWPPPGRTPRSSRWRSPPTRRAACPSRRAPSTSSWKLWITRWMFRRRLIRRLVNFSPSRAVGSKRLNVSRRSCEAVCWPACRSLVAEGGAAGVQQDPQVRARVAVERRQHLVGVHVGQRVGDRDPAALLDLAGRSRCPGRAPGSCP